MRKLLDLSLQAIHHLELLKTQFIKLVQSLRPGYNPPSRIKVADELLESVYVHERKQQMDSLSGQLVSLSLDGWSNIHNDPIVCTSITLSDGKSVLLDTVDTSGNQHDSNYLLSLAKSSISKLKTDYNVDVGSVITDNTANVKKMRDLLSQESDILSTRILTYGCTAHLLNLLMQDVQVQGVKENVLEVVKYFRNNHFAAAKYKEMGKPKLILPTDTRWNSFVDCLEIYLGNWSSLLAICDENRKKIAHNVSKLVMNISLKRSAEDLLTIMKPIAVALDRLQRSFSTIADSVQTFKILEGELSEAPQSVKEHLKKRKSQALMDFHFLANLLHPVYRGLKLNETEMQSAMTLAAEISSKCPKFLGTLIGYKGQSGIFQEALFHEDIFKDVTALEWWQSMKNQLDPDVLRFIIQLLSATSSTASLERFFSSFGIVQSELRNRLGNEKAAKLVFLLRTLNE